jgi:hypothetical protein
VLLLLLLPLHHHRLPTTAPGLGPGLGLHLCVPIVHRVSCIVYRVSHLDPRCTCCAPCPPGVSQRPYTDLPLQFQPQPRAPAVSSSRPSPRLPAAIGIVSAPVAVQCTQSSWRPCAHHQCVPVRWSQLQCCKLPVCPRAQPAQLSPARLSCLLGGKRAQTRQTTFPAERRESMPRIWPEPARSGSAAAVQRQCSDSDSDVNSSSGRCCVSCP